MHQSYVRPGSAAAAVPAIAATAGEYSSDEVLVERIAAGDKLAMQALFARHRTNIYRWLLRFVGNETVAEDLLSDVFLDVWRQAGRFEGRSAVTTWLLSIARFKARSRRTIGARRIFGVAPRDHRGHGCRLRRQRRGCSGEKAPG